MTTAPASPSPSPAPSSRLAEDPHAADSVLIAALSVTIALLHISAAAGHLAESGLYAGSFVLLAAFQLGWGVALVFRPRRGPRRARLLGLGVAINVVVVLVWVCSRTLGLPVGPDLHHPEAVGLPDLMATLDELALITISAAMLRRRRPLPERAVAASCLLMVCSLLVFVVLAHIS